MSIGGHGIGHGHPVTVMQLLTEVSKDVLQSLSSRIDDEVKSELKK